MSNTLGQDGVRRNVFVPPEDCPHDFSSCSFSDPADLLARITQLRDRSNICPKAVLAQALGIHKSTSPRQPWTDQDALKYLDCELGLLIGGTHRLMGRLTDAASWFAKVEKDAVRISRAEVLLAQLEYQRLTILMDTRAFADALVAAPEVRARCSNLGMVQESSRCAFIEGVALKALGREAEAMAVFEGLVADERTEDGVRGYSLSNLGNIFTFRRESSKALALYRRALPFLQRCGWVAGIADLKTGLAETLRVLGRPEEAVKAYKDAVDDLESSGFIGRAAYIRILLAEALIQVGSYQEACLEIVRALPVIADEHMVHEGVVAMGLLRESIRRGRPDAEALSTIKACLSESMRIGEGG